MKSYIKPSSDIFFKFLLSLKEHNDLLLSFVNAVISDFHNEKIVIANVKNPFNIKEFETDKESIVDIKATDERGRHYDIEAQSSNRGHYLIRSLYYWATLFSSQLSENDDYTKLNPTIGIHLLDFTLFKGHEYSHTYCSIRQNHDLNEKVTDYFILHFLELSKLTTVHTKNKLMNWLLFFKNEGSTEDRMAKTIKKLVEEDEDIARAHEIYQRFTNDERMRQLYESRLKWKLDHNTEIVVAREEGMEKGEIRDKHQILSLLISQKFGITDSEKKQITSIQDKNKLDNAIARILTATSKDELFALLT